MGEMRTDVLIAGGGLGGCAAAIAAARLGARVVITEVTDWIGGQSTQQAVPPDEHPWIEMFGCTRTYRAWRDGIRDYYRTHYPLTSEAMSNPQLNPGNGNVSRLCHEPRAGLAVLQSMLAAPMSGGKITLLLKHEPIAAQVSGDRVESVTFRSLESGATIEIAAPMFIDATEQGDLLPLTKTEYVTGFESQKETGEPRAPAEAQPSNIQSFTWCFAMDYLAGEDHTIDRPEEYAFWRDYVPDLAPPWTGKLLHFENTHPVTLEPRTHLFDPEEVERSNRGPNLWLYRRIADRRNFADGAYPGDITLVNWPQNDFWLGPLHTVSDDEAAANGRRAKQLSLSLLYWLQTEAPRPDGGTGWKGLRLRKDLMGTEDGLAKYPYIRESRRIRAEFTVVEQHVSTEFRKSQGSDAAEKFADSVGVGSYRIDLHPSTGGNNYIDLSSLPFQIPLGALIPRRVENLLPACKNLGVTHITNGCYRLHPVEWNIGEAAGALAAHSLATKQSPRAIRNDAARLKAFQRVISQLGIETDWPKVTPR